MASIINAATSGGLISTADTSGILQLQTAGTTAVTVDASQNVGVGTSSPSNRLSVVTASGSDGFVSVKSPLTDTAGVVVDGGTTSNKGAILKFLKNAVVKWQMGTDSAIIGGTSDNFHLYGGGADAMLFSTNATERARIPAAGGIQSKTTISVGDATPSASGAGITFPATQSASTDANTLDDYEEGSWTPTLTASTTAPSSVSYADQTARYTKVGRVVTVMMFLQINNRTGGSGNTRIEGLPFTSQNVGTAVLGSIYLGLVNWGASRTALYCSVGQNSTYINIGALGTNLDPTGIAISEFNNTDDYVGITITYFV